MIASKFCITINRKGCEKRSSELQIDTPIYQLAYRVSAILTSVDRVLLGLEWFPATRLQYAE